MQVKRGQWWVATTCLEPVRHLVTESIIGDEGRGVTACGALVGPIYGDMPSEMVTWADRCTVCSLRGRLL